MKFALYGLAAGLAIATSAAPALAFGRGGAVRGAAVGPAGGVRTGGAARGVATGPLGGVHAGNVHGGSYTGPGGATVQHVGGGGVNVGPLGGVRAGGGGATRVTGPGGQSVTHANAGGVAAGPLGGVRAGGAGGTVVNGAYGGAAVGHRGGVAVGPGGGVVAGGARGGVVGNPYGGYRAGGVRVGAVGHTTAYMSPNSMRASAAIVRGGFRYPYFTPTFYRTHIGVWNAPRWVVGYNLWAPPVWTSIAPFIGISGPPIVYDYGSNVVINDNTVYVDGTPAGSAADYAAQAVTLADTGRAAQPADTDEWQPLGVFGLIQGDEQTAQRIFQLAVNKSGVIRGNYYDAVADTNTPVYGSVDPKTQRVAWSIGEKKDIVFETGLPNLTKDESSVLIHYGKDRTQQMMLVRLEEPKGDM